MPVMARMVVVLPAPFGPSKPRISPRPHLKTKAGDGDGLAVGFVVVDDFDQGFTNLNVSGAS